MTIEKNPKTQESNVKRTLRQNLISAVAYIHIKLNLISNSAKIELVKGKGSMTYIVEKQNTGNLQATREQN